MLADLAGIGSSGCGITGGAGKIPFICFDLSGGANIAGSNVLIGKQGGQMDFLTTAGYSKLGLPGNMTPNLPNQIDRTFGLAFHTDSAFLRGMKMRARPRHGRAAPTARSSRRVPRTTPATIRTTRCTALRARAPRASC